MKKLKYLITKHTNYQFKKIHSLMDFEKVNFDVKQSYNNKFDISIYELMIICNYIIKIIL